jgi:hypothetical protein
MKLLLLGVLLAACVACQTPVPTPSPVSNPTRVAPTPPPSPPLLGGTAVLKETRTVVDDQGIKRTLPRGTTVRILGQTAPDVLYVEVVGVDPDPKVCPPLEQCGLLGTRGYTGWP